MTTSPSVGHSLILHQDSWLRPCSRMNAWMMVGGGQFASYYLAIVTCKHVVFLSPSSIALPNLPCNLKSFLQKLQTWKTLLASPDAVKQVEVVVVSNLIIRARVWMCPSWWDGAELLTIWLILIAGVLLGLKRHSFFSPCFFSKVLGWQPIKMHTLIL